MAKAQNWLLGGRKNKTAKATVSPNLGLKTFGYPKFLHF